MTNTVTPRYLAGHMARSPRSTCRVASRPGSTVPGSPTPTYPDDTDIMDRLAAFLSRPAGDQLPEPVVPRRDVPLLFRVRSSGGRARRPATHIGRHAARATVRGMLGQAAAISVSLAFSVGST